MLKTILTLIEPHKLYENSIRKINSIKVFLPLALVISFNCHRTKETLSFYTHPAHYIAPLVFTSDKYKTDYAANVKLARPPSASRPEIRNKITCRAEPCLTGWLAPMYYGESQQIARDQNSRLRIRFPGILLDEDICCSIYGHGSVSAGAWF